MAPEWVVVAAVLGAAFLHASWNAIAKASSDPLLTITTVTTTGGLVAAVAIPMLPLPAAAAWPCLAASVVLHFLYQLALVRSYELGDLSHVYPIARGLAPLGVALLAVLAGEVPTVVQAAGLLLASGSVASLALASPVPHPSGSALKSALLTAVFISGYTVVDGLGVRWSGAALSYIAWIFFLDSFPMLVYALLRRGRRIGPFLRREGLWGAGGGLMATLGYGVVLWALSRSAMAGIAALRETSVIFAAFIGSRLLGEPFGRLRLAAACALAVGLVLVQQ